VRAAGRAWPRCGGAGVQAAEPEGTTMLVRVPEDGAGGDEVPVLGAGVQGTLETHLPVLEGRLYLSSSRPRTRFL